MRLGRLLWWRRKRQPDPIGEAEAYQHSYGVRTEDVKVIKLPPPPPPRRPRNRKVLESGELLRLAFLERLERRRSGGGRPPAD
jgi:hypothetical protein